MTMKTYNILRHGTATVITLLADRHEINEGMNTLLLYRGDAEVAQFKQANQLDYWVED